MDTKEVFDRGMAIRRDMMGAEAANKEILEASDFDKPMQDLVTSYCFGEVWTRPPFDRKTRSMLTIAMLIGVNRLGPLKIHFKGGLANGMTKEEIRELILHAAIYGGVAAATEAMRVAKEAFKEAGVE